MDGAQLWFGYIVNILYADVVVFVVQYRPCLLPDLFPRRIRQRVFTVFDAAFAPRASTSQTSWALVLAAGWHADHPDKCDLPRRYPALAVPFLSVLDPFLSLARPKVVRKQRPGSWLPATATQVPRAVTALRLPELYVGPHFSLYPPFLPPPSPPSLPHRPHLLRSPCLTFTTGCTPSSILRMRRPHQTPTPHRVWSPTPHLVHPRLKFPHCSMACPFPPLSLRGTRTGHLPVPLFLFHCPLCSSQMKTAR